MPYNFPYMPLMPQQSNLPQAEAAMNLTPQEQDLYMRHLFNLYSPMGGVELGPHSRATLYQGGTQDTAGMEYNIPTVYEGRILPHEEAVARANAQGLQNFPSYGTADEAERRYQQMHEFMDRDMGDYFDNLETTDPAEAMAYGVIHKGG